jgi:beta-phosphoglucomutase
MKIKEVIFDLDGVLTTSSREHFNAWSELAQQLGSSLSGSICDAVRGRSRMESLDIVLADIGMSGRFSDAEKQALAERKNSIYVNMISQFDERNLEPGALALFDLLQKNDVRIALGSASNNANLLLERMGIIDRFDYIVTPSAIRHAKPAPDIFLDAADHFGFAYRLCVGIEDAKAGIQAIKSAGMFAIGIGDPQTLTQADIVCPTLRDVDILRVDRIIA